MESLKPTTIALTVFILAGCAAGQDAQSTASEANARAARAEGAAAASQKCCAANTERMNRMFEKSMQK